MNSSHIITQDAALITTFYGPRGQLDPLLQHLLKAFEPFVAHTSGFWWHEARQISLRVLEPVEAQDTGVIQLTLSLPDDAKAQNGWATMRWELFKVLEQEAHWQNVWGYTLLFQARVSAESWRLVEKQDEAALERLSAMIRPLRVLNPQTPTRLAHSEVPGGWLFLLRVPLEEAQLDPAMIYMALAPSGKNENQEERKLVQKVLVGEKAMLFLPDLIAHKGYQQRREYRQGDIKARYEAAAERLFNETTSLLAQKEGKQRASLDALAQQYQSFLAVVPQLETLRLSLARQLYNIEQIEAQNELGPILSYHHGYLRATAQELNLLVAKGKETLDVTKTAIELVQARLDEAKAQRQQKIETLLALIGSAFAIPQVLDRDFIAALYHYFLPSSTEPTAPFDFIQLTIGLSPTQENTLFFGMMQIAITLAIAFTFGCLVWWRQR